ncbi:MAG: Ig-like domain-containing protein [Bdellovibrionaceae bacterium]|nr:Ig-like domain-containing protein [Pseudobdellovibrionaceae bacterium]
MKVHTANNVLSRYFLKSLKTFQLLLLSSSFIACTEGIGNKQITEQGSLGINLVVASGDGQFADPGQKFNYPIVAKVVDPLGDPIPGVTVEFSTEESNGASILTASTISDRTGNVATNILAPNKLDKKFVVYAKLPKGQIQIPFNLATFPEQLLVISDGPTYDFESEAVGAVRSFAFILDNTGTSKATNISGFIEDLPFKFKGGAFPGTGGTCGLELNGGEDCKFVVSFAPTEVGFFASEVEIHYKDNSIERVATRSLKDRAT